MSRPSDREQLEFLTKLQRLLAEGDFTATYKFALLLALADIAVEKGDDSGSPMHVGLDHIAEKFIRLYWRQADTISVSPRTVGVASNTRDPGWASDELRLETSVSEYVVVDLTLTHADVVQAAAIAIQMRARNRMNLLILVDGTAGSVPPDLTIGGLAHSASRY